MTENDTVERRSGISLWRQIADRIRMTIIADTGRGEDRLPPELVLAQRFGVNRHTVRAAIAALVQEGVLRSEQGRGTFIVRRKRVAYPIRQRTRFSSGLAGQAGDRISKLLSSARETAPGEIAGKLDLAPGAPVIRLEMLSLADGTPLSVATHWFDARRFDALPNTVGRTGSITQGLQACGIRDYLRAETAIEATHATPEDREALRLSPGAIVLAARAVNTDGAGRPIQCSVTRFAADRVSLVVDHAADAG